jgi:hypothetical protein
MPPGLIKGRLYAGEDEPQAETHQEKAADYEQPLLPVL